MAKKKKKSDVEHYFDAKKAVQSEGSAPPQKGYLPAKKDWVFCQNDYYREIKQGDDVSDMTENMLLSLKTEGVI